MQKKRRSLEDGCENANPLRPSSEISGNESTMRELHACKRRNDRGV